MHPIPHRPFGKTGLRLPVVLFGATSLGNLFVAQSRAVKRDLIRRWRHCVTAPIAIDSAGKYGAGLSLEVIGQELAADGVDPDQVIISNKLGWRRVPLTENEPTFEPGVWIDIEHDAVQDISYDGILRCWEDGCRMLSPYTPQLVSVHDPDEYLAAASDSADRTRRLDDVVGAYRALMELKSEGKVAGVGVGAKNWRIIRELHEHCDFDWVMLANSLTIMNHPPELVTFVESLARDDIAVINSALTHGGFLTGGEYLDYRKVDPSDPDDQATLRWRDNFLAVCRQHHVSPYDAAVAFGASLPSIEFVALSTSRPERVDSMLRAAGVQLPNDFWSSLQREQLIEEHFRRHLS